MNLLITSVGRRSYLVEYFKAALGDRGSVYVANSSERTPAFTKADGCVVTPLIYADEYIPFLIDYCKKNGIAAILSLFDIDLPVLAKHQKEFQEIGVHVIVSDESVIDICNDKWKGFQFLRREGFPVPETFIDKQEALEEIRNHTIAFPLVIKPRWGMGSISVLEADNELELEILYEKVKRNVFRTYLRYESGQNPEQCVLIQEKLTGQEYGLDIINNLRGEYITTVVKKKYNMRAGETDCAMTVRDERISGLGKRLSNKMHHVANLDVDVFCSDDKFYVLDMNARFGGGYPFSHEAGADLPLAIVKWLEGEEPGWEAFNVRENVVSCKDISIVSWSGGRCFERE